MIKNMTIYIEHVAIVNDMVGIFGEKESLLSALTHSLAMDVYTVIILRVASQRQSLVMESYTWWR